MGTQDWQRYFNEIINEIKDSVYNEYDWDIEVRICGWHANWGNSFNRYHGRDAVTRAVVLLNG